ncbi:MAG: hypothetical protein WKF77_12710 [Planctomycetaceae bacterium]
MSDKTSLVLLFMAGDETTAFQIDPLLEEIQCGLKNIPLASDRPDVYCLYLRRSTTGQQFKITDTPEIKPNGFGGLTNFPPPGSVPLTGSLSSQLTTFLQHVGLNLTASGPVHFIIGAHGVPVSGFHPVLFFRLVFAFLRSFFSFELRGLTWRARFWRLRDRIFLIGQPLGAIASGSKLPDLTLDDTALALKKLPCLRLNSVILHTCNLSGIETMSALRAAKFHIACESELANWMRFRKWFLTLASPTATPELITKACMDSMELVPSDTLGCFSSHRVDCETLLNKLNALGNQLTSLLKSTDSTIAAATKEAIRIAKVKSGVSNYTVDVVVFCRNLGESTNLPIGSRQAANAVADEIANEVQLRLIMTDSWKTSNKFKFYGGISMYLPLRNDPYYPTEHLPESFRTGAPDWIEFLKIWDGTTT